jgi:SWI/SNF-related matrix-associated actin-dependent regulator of chromatin subfamily A3
MLTRMRQIALYPGLVPVNYLDELQAAKDNEGASKPIVIMPAERVRLQYMLAQAIEDCEECKCPWSPPLSRT